MTTNEQPPTTRAEYAARLEHQLVRVRWFGVAFGLFQLWQDTSRPLPSHVLPLAFALVGLLAAGNVAVMARIRRAPSSPRWLGRTAFGLDAFVLLSMAWLYSFDRNDVTWVLLYVLPLEGAMRFRLRGAMASVLLACASELAREIYRVSLFPDLDFQISTVTFRVGIMAIVAFVAGLMANSLAQQAASAEHRAHAFEELARREAAARRELSAFHEIVLAGIVGEDTGRALEGMASVIGTRLGHERVCILVPNGNALRCGGGHGAHSLGHGSRLAERSARQRAPVLATDEMAVPMTVGEDLIGVLHVHSGGGPAELEVLSRLTAQVALVASSVQLHAERAETVARLHELAQIKSDFVAITSHELRTPLTGIRGFASLLLNSLDDLPKEEVREFLAIIDGQSQRLSRLVEDLLVVSKLESGRLKLVPVEVEVRPFLERLIASFADDAPRLHLEMVDHPTAHFDPDRVEQVLRNLLHNALKFSPEERPVVLRAGEGEGSLGFDVVDRGIGIPPEQAETVFNRFYQVDNGERQQGEGVGLGLYITKRLVDEMGGSIAVRSVPGSETTFSVRLPSAVPVDQPA